ncbi:MAG: hypothetical protein M1837_007060 [Sclerophora amabilis]|nr:MAG: hypothetical protein M1837_007060 [Sclerophora amabilis]
MAETANPDTANVIEPDDFGPDETDSAFGSDAGSDMTSLASSIQRYRHENGRRYHAYKDGNYNFPNDDQEMDRLDLQHHLFSLTTNGKLHLAPIKKDVQRVLDIGTGTGIWAIDFADEYPSAEVIGTDLSPTQPTFVPPNLRFIIDDAEETWVFGKKFDYIHGRMLVGSFTNWSRFFEQCYENLEPGGWLELQDLTAPLKCDDGTVKEDLAISKWDRLLRDAGENIGRRVDTPRSYTKWMTEAGFTNVQLVPYKWPQNPWPKADREKEIGLWNQQNMEDGLQGLSMGLLTRALGWSQREVEMLLVEVRKDFRNKYIHGYWDVFMVYGQKPETHT